MLVEVLTKVIGVKLDVVLLNEDKIDVVTTIKLLNEEPVWVMVVTIVIATGTPEYRISINYHLSWR